MYRSFGKRLLDFCFSLAALVLLSPLLLLLALVGAIVMKGNPFFTQERPGKDEKIFGMYKFRSMTNARDENGELLPDEVRLTPFGRRLRSTSLDELPELINIFKGEMSFVGPRPLLVDYLPYYTAEEAHRHDVRPGLTGWAQVNGRSVTAWDERLQQDLYYVEHISFWLDCKIILMTAMKVVRRSDILVGAQHGEGHGRLDKVRHYIPQR